MDYGVAVGDFNHDGIADLAVAMIAAAVPWGILLETAAEDFKSAGTFSSGGNDCRTLAVGDFNGDGKLDILVDNYTVRWTPARQRQRRIRAGHDCRFGALRPGNCRRGF